MNISVILAHPKAGRIPLREGLQFIAGNSLTIARLALGFRG